MDGACSHRNTFALICLVVFASGCTSTIVPRHSPLLQNSISASQLPQELVERRRNDLVPIDLTLLQQTLPEEHIIGTKDVLAISVENILEQEGELPRVYLASEEALAKGVPTAGHPIRVETDGTVVLPYIEPVSVAGMTLPAATEAIRQAYLGEKLLKRGRDRIAVNLIQPRTHHVVVMREDAAGTGVINRSVQLLAQRGSGDTIELPTYKNDVLHALTATGGLPGADTFNEVWVFRQGFSQDPDGARIISVIQSGEDPSELLFDREIASNCLRIPLRVPLGSPPCFSPDDVVLHDGDVVYVTSRDDVEYFVGGGLLNGGKYILPRDRDTDIFDAIAIANSNALGPAGANAAATNFRSGPGNIIAPTRVVVVRQLSTGEQLKIRVDLRAATNDPRERLLIQPGDVVLLKYKPSELLGNIALNFINVGFSIPNR